MINNFVSQMYKKQLLNVAICQGVFLLLAGHCWCSSTLTEQFLSRESHIFSVLNARLYVRFNLKSEML